MWSQVDWEGLSAFKVNEGSALETHVKKFIHSVWGSENENVFPGPHPVSIERVHLPLLRKQPYVVCEKTDGTRYFLACVTFEEKKFTIFVNRAFDMFIVSLPVPRNTLIDGEMVNGKFMIFDAVIVNGTDLRALDYISRLKAAEAVTRGPPTKLRLVMKKMWPLSGFKQLTDQKFEYDTDGYIFTPVNEPIRMETHETMFKWKPLDRITVDFMVISNTLCVWDRKHGMVRIQPIAPGYETEIVECAFKNKQWVPVKVRKDKSHPNNRRTYLRTIVNINEDIKPEEFVC